MRKSVMQKETMENDAVNRLTISHLSYIWLLSLLTIITLLVKQVQAENLAYVPQDKQMVIFTYNKQGETKPDIGELQVLSHLYQRSQLPGQSYLITEIQARLNFFLSYYPASAESEFLQASLYQRQHKFARAQAILQKLVKQQAGYANYGLMLANVALQQGQFKLAKDACARLLGHAANEITLTCMLEVESLQLDSWEGKNDQKKLNRTYQALLNVVQPEQNNNIWIAQVAAEMALNVDKLQQAERWLSFYPLESMPVSALALWADIQLAQTNYTYVLHTLGSLVSKTQSSDDALILRLAIAEKQLGHANLWQQKMKTLVDLRSQRNDVEHAAELAQYYLQVAPQPQLAMQWAQKHYELSHTAKDNQILRAAQTALWAE
ncbi:tetratricopeptide repeat protein [Catenovulum sediminis]|uniref:Uncharacterized protein n=1 Tax=Catenovulum sediminis TaxID=1740262 RepID=A0ABV1RFZ5_9ALTE|nr:tetratricopeptide repeat protein [Catenovulum sediminis]